MYFREIVVVRFATDCDLDRRIICISPESVVPFRDKEIKITDIENYVAGMEAELATAYLTSNEAHANEISNMKYAHYQEVVALQETIAMYEATLAEAHLREIDDGPSTTNN